MQAVNKLIDWMRAYEQCMPIVELVERLDDDSISARNLVDYIHFSEERYSRNLLAHGPQFYALVMCWKPGQASPVHDHKGAACGVRVIQGVATEASYRWRGTQLVEDVVSSMRAGEVCGSFDEDIHQIRNNGPENLVTLHVYSPYLDNINLYDISSGEVSVFSDPLVARLQSV